MSTSPGLAPAGSSSYASNSMTVGDGTWDATSNTFLLPNLVGLNFETMRYNGELSTLHIPRLHGRSRAGTDEIMLTNWQCRDGKSLSRTAGLLQPHTRPWCHRSHHLSLHRAGRHSDCPIQFSCQRCPHSCIATNHYRPLVDRRHRSQLQRRRPISTSLESSSWHRPCHIYPRPISVLLGLVDASKRAQQER